MEKVGFDEDEAAALLVQASQYINAGEWITATECLNKVVFLEPDNGAAYQQRALAHLELGMLDSALEDADAAVRLEPDDSESYLCGGAAYVKVGEFEKAIEDLTFYIDEEDGSPVRGSHALAMGSRFASRGYYLRGLAYAGLRDFPQAIKDFGLAIRRWPDWPEPYEVAGRRL